MKPISDKYEKVFSKYYFDAAKQRFVDLTKYLEVYGEQIDFKTKLVIAVDHIKVNAFVTSYFLDVIRFKEYHFKSDADAKSKDEASIHTKLVSQSKAAAFTLKWMLKYQPLIVFAQDPFKLSEHERVFLEFLPFLVAINFALRTMGIRPRDVPKEIFDDLLYHIRFRPYEERGFMLYFDLLIKQLSSVK
jgi:hypothetical protein